MIPTKAINLLIEMWPMLLLFVIVLITIRLTYIKVNKKKFVLYKELLSLSFIVYILLLFELVTSTDFESYSNNFIPFKEMFRYHLNSKLFYRNVIGNILIFVPFGYFISRAIKPRGVATIIIDSVLTSLTVELVQLNIGRSFDIDDIMLNMVGGIVGYFLYVGLDAIYNHLPRFLQRDFIYDLICGIIFIGFVAYMLKVVGIWWLNGKL